MEDGEADRGEGGPDPLTPAEQRAGMRYAYVSQSLGTHLTLFLSSSAIIPLYIKRLGGSDLEAMLPSAFLALAQGLQLPAAMFVRPRNIRTFLVRCWFGSTFPVLLALLLALCIKPGPLVVHIVLGGVLGSLLLLSLGATFWFPLLHDVVPAGERGRFFGRLRALWSSVYLVLGVGAGMFLGGSPPLWKFTAVLGMVTLLQMLREPFVARIPVRIHPVSPHDWREEWRAVFHRRDLLLFVVYFALLSFLTGFIGQPTVLYMQQLGIPAGSNTVIRAMSTAGSVLALLVAGVLLDRVGTKRVFMAVHVVLCALALCLVLAGELPRELVGALMTVLLILSGAAIAAAGLACTAQIFHLAPERGRTFYLNFSTAVTALGAGLSPVLAGWMLDSKLGSSVLRVAGVEFGALQILFALTALGLLLAIALLPLVDDVHAGREEMEA